MSRWSAAIDPKEHALHLFSRKKPSEVERRISNLAIHNLSSRQLNFHERKLLGLGLKYIPCPPSMPSVWIWKEYTALARKLRLKQYFKKDTDDDSADHIDPFKLPNPNFNVPRDKQFKPLEKIISYGYSLLKDRVSEVPVSKERLLPMKLQRALKDLRRDKNIIIKPADKNLGTVVLDKSWYVQEAERQLFDPLVYEEVSEVPWNSMWLILSIIISRYDNLIKSVKPFLCKIKPADSIPCAFYLLPKIHKPVLSGRPICGYSNYMLEPASRFLHHMLYPVLLAQPQHLPDSISLIRDLRSMTFPSETLLFTFDVESLYPSIPTDEGLEALRIMSEPHFSNNRIVDMCLELATLVLKNHFLEFNGHFFKQIRGTAMGSNFVVVYACLFLCHLENQVALKMDLSLLSYFKRYIDDAVGMWQGSKEGLMEYFTCYASIYPEINITHCISDKSVNILDIIFFKGDDFGKTGILSSSCFQKPLNAYQYLPFSSWHPRHQKVSFVTSELVRFLLRESLPRNFIRLRNLFYQRLRARGYPKEFLISCFSKVSIGDRPTLLDRFCSRSRIKSKRAPLVLKMDYCRYTRELNLGAALNSKLFRLCHQVPELRHIPRPLVCWRNPKKLRNFLVRSRFRPDPVPDASSSSQIGSGLEALYQAIIDEEASSNPLEDNGHVA